MIEQLAQQLQQTNSQIRMLNRELTVLRRLLNKVDNDIEETTAMGVGKQIDQIQDTLAAMSNVLTQLTANIVNTKSVCNDLLVDVKTIKTDITTIKTDIATLKTGATDLKSDTTVIKSDTGVIKSDTAAIKTKVDA
jgi:chromosome segregation ATPase